MQNNYLNLYGLWRASVRPLEPIQIQAKIAG